VQLDKTVRYETTIPIGKGFFFAPGESAESNIFKKVLRLFQSLSKSIEKSMDGELSMVRVIIITTSLANFLFGIMGTDEFYYRTINLGQAFFGLLIVVFTFTDFAKINIRKVGNLFIYLLDISNATLVATSHFNDKLSYQYIIYFFVSSLFFNNKKSLLACILINSLLVVGFVFLPTENSSSVSDFYTAFIASEFALYMLMMRRFNLEAKLAENESKYRLLAENSADVICTHNRRGEFDFVSPSITSLTGYEPSELIGESIDQFIYYKDRFSYKRKLCSNKETITDEPFQYRFRAKDGNYIWLESVVRGFGEKKNGNEKHFLSQSRSFQKHYEYQEQIKIHSNELQSSYKDLEMFAYISSHDMQEPLRMISNYMQLLKRKYESKLDSDAMEYIDFAVKGASNLQALIKDLLSYSTINKKEINFTTVDMDTLLDDVLSGLQLLMQEKNVKIYINEPMIPLMGDKNAVTQLIQNLIQNGIKYNVSEQPVIRVSCREDDGHVIYCIQDNGIGIDKQYAQQIFEPFQRLHNKHNFPGTGLGLSICRKIIDRLNGQIWVDSEPGVGSSFYFSIPKVAKAAA
jgi:PAS domain S-box-containing protein